MFLSENNPKSKIKKLKYLIILKSDGKKSKILKNIKIPPIIIGFFSL